MGTVDRAADELVGEKARFEALPERVQEALGELAGAAKEGLLALSVGVGPTGRHDPDCSAVRHGCEAGEVTLGGRRVLHRPSAGAGRRGVG
jgi:hypothetical protein